MTPTAADIVAALERRYNPEGKPRQFATFTEVTDGAQSRRIDFLAVNLWQSRGRIIEGVEIKVQRRDWLREISREKADAWYGVADRWWIAAPPGVLKREELPPTWGYLEARKHGPAKHRLFVEREAPALQPREAWPEWMVLRLLTRGEDRRKATPEEIHAAREEGRQRGEEYGRAREAIAKPYDDGAARELEELLEAIGGEGFAWRSQKEIIAEVRRAVEVLHTGRLDMVAAHAARTFRQTADRIEAALRGESSEPDLL